MRKHKDKKQCLLKEALEDKKKYTVNFMRHIMGDKTKKIWKQ